MGNQPQKFTVTIAESNADLYAAIKKFPNYHKSKRLVQLANLGLAVEQGRSVTRGNEGQPHMSPAIAVQQTAPAAPEPTRGKSSDSKTNGARVEGAYYKHTSDTTDLFAEALERLDK